MTDDLVTRLIVQYEDSILAKEAADRIAALEAQVAALTKGPYDESEDAQKAIASYRGVVNNTPALLSLLYDADLLPEQIISIRGAISLGAVVEAYKMGAEWMRREAEKIVVPMAYSNSPVAANAGQAAYNAIRAIPNPTPADLPKVRALVDAMKWAWGHLCTLPMDEANSESLLSFRAALASLTAIPSPAPEPHANALGYPTIADILRDLDHELSDHGYGSRGRVRGLVLAALAKLKGGAV